MTTYLSEPVAVDQGAIKDEIVDALTARLPGLDVAPGTAWDYLTDAFASITAQDRQLLTDVLAIIFRYYGEKILRVAQRAATQATGLSTWTASDTLGHTIAAGTQITLAALDGSRVAFQTLADVTIPPGVPKAVTGVAATDIFTSTAHGYVADQPVSFSALTGGAGITTGIAYYILAPTTNTFQVAATPGGTALNFTTDLTVGTVTAWPRTAIGEVALIAVLAGADGTGLSGDPQPEDTIGWLSSISIVAPTAGGADAEDDDAYLDRLADTTPLSAMTLVTPENFERASRLMVTDQGRALALDLYKPGPPYDGTAAASGVEKTITVALVNEAGADYGGTIRASVQTQLDALRETGFSVWVIAPTYTTLTIAFTAIAAAGYDPADVETRAEQALLDFISPARWGLPPVGDQRLWIDKPIVRYQDLVTVLNNVDGIDYYTALTLNAGTADVTMTGPAALPAPSPTSTVAGTVTL